MLEKECPVSCCKGAFYFFLIKLLGRVFKELRASLFIKWLNMRVGNTQLIVNGYRSKHAWID